MTPDGGVAVESRACEIERAAGEPVRLHGQHRLDHIRVGAVSGRCLGCHHGGDVTQWLVGQQAKAGGQNAGGHERHIALQIDHHVAGAVAVEVSQRRQDAVRAGRQVRIGQNSAPAGSLDRRDDLRIARGNHDRTGPRRLRLTQNTHDHWQTPDICQRLAGQAGRGHSRGDDDDRVHRLGMRRG